VYVLATVRLLVLVVWGRLLVLLLLLRLLLHVLL
jgi:hypothetical protein